MSGHSKWSSIKHKKAAVDAKRGKIFTKIIKEITVAARLGGGDIDSNARLRTAVAGAKAANMPGSNIEKAIKKGTGELPGVTYEEITYEGYGPGGVAVMIEVMTDNKNRTVSEMRYIFSKNGGNLGESGCVAWMFEKKGLILVDGDKATEDDLLLTALEAGAEDMKIEDGMYEIMTTPDNFEKVRKVTEEKGIEMSVAEVSMIPNSTIKLEGKQAQRMLKLMETLEDHDDVQKVYANFDIPQEVMVEMGG